MSTIIVKDNSLSARQFLAFVRTLPFVDVLEDSQEMTEKFKKTVVHTLKESEEGKNLTTCTDADDMFHKLGI
ncbi:hypothetical protein AGMMS50239_28590 [Bacteroidia bacterium]|nr:hypothetical protein AGMMS50239_28590 [Bacteroidia bacterium]